MMLFPLVVSFFDDEFIFLTSMWLQIIFYIEVILAINRYLIRNQVENQKVKIFKEIQ